MVAMLLGSAMALSLTPIPAASAEPSEKLSKTEISAKAAEIADGRDADIEALLAEAIAAKQDEEPRIDEESQKLIDERIDEAIAAEDAALLPVADVPIAANAQSGSANAAYAEGAGTEEDPFVLGSAYDLLLIADDVAAGVSAYYLLATDIDLSGMQWEPIGSPTNPFTGHLDGAGHTIANLAINTSGDYAALIAFARNATIENIEFVGATVNGVSKSAVVAGQTDASTIGDIVLTGCIVSGSSSTAGLVGVASNTTIEGCSCNAWVKSSGTLTGGVCSLMVEGRVENTMFTGTVEGGYITGGIVGQFSDDAEKCANAGDVSETSTVGGIAGILAYQNRQKNVIHCFNIGNVRGTTEVGGIAGYSLSTCCNYDMSATVMANANAGSVTASGSYAGGIIGDVASNTFVMGCYNKGAVSAGGTGCGGIVGRYNATAAFFTGASALYNVGKVKEGTQAGALVGYCCATTLKNSHYLSEQPAGYQVPAIAVNNTRNTVTLPHTAAEMKTLTGTLGTRFADDAAGINDGYPILVDVGYAARDASSHGRTFNYAGNKGYDAASPYYYDDGYFDQSAYVYNEHLATMSLSLAMSAFASLETGYENQSANARALLTDIGFSGIEANSWFSVKPTADSIGAIVGSKSVASAGTNCTLIAVAIRGAGYESEWASNFTIGDQDDHAGFAAARDEVLGFLNAYIAEKNITGNVKLWLTGYSRAAATANLVAGELDGGGVLSGCTYTPSDVYAYTFETPRGTLTGISNSEIYGNIFNIVNESDPVPKVAPQAWDFTWYGTVKWIPSFAIDGDAYAAKLEKMLSRYEAIGSGQDAASAYRIDDFSEHEISFDVAYMLDGKFPVQFVEKEDSRNQDAFLNDAVDSLATESLVSRANYVEQYQNGIREVFSILNMSDEQRQRFGSLLAKKIYDNYGFLLLASGAYGGLSVLEGNDDFAEYLLKTPMSFMVQYAEESLNESGITDYSPAQIEQLGQDLFRLVMGFVTNNPGETLDLVSNCVKVVDGQIVGGGIPQAHYPEICLAWIQSMDSNYAANAYATFSKGGGTGSPESTGPQTSWSTTREVSS